MCRNAVMVCHHDLRLVVLSVITSILAFAARGQLGLAWLAGAAVMDGAPGLIERRREARSDAMNPAQVLLVDDHAPVRAGICALLMLALVSPVAVAQTAVETPRTIRVVLDNAYAPYSFQSDGGKLQGILVDQWQAWEKKTGIRVEIHALDWGEALRRMRAGEFDVIDSIVETPERRDYFDFTPAYTPIEASIFFRNEISGITDLASLKGFPVGVKTGDQHIDQLKANGVMTVIPFENNDAIIGAAKQHKINVFVVDDPSALYLLNKTGIEGEFRHSAPMFHDELRRAVRKGNAGLLREVSDGFAAIEPAELKQINEKWFGRTINWIGQYLTYAGYAVAATFVIIAGLAVWNRTLRKKVLQRTAALGESEQRFRRLVELMPVAVYVCDTSGIIQSYNNRAVELWGRKPKSGDTAQRYCASLRLYSPEGKLVPHEESKMAEVLRTGVEARDLEVVIERPDGSCITVLVNIAPLRNGKGELIGAMNCFQDITERKQAQDRLRRSEEKFKALFGIAPVGISVLDGHHNVVDANSALEQILRLSKEELLNGTWRRRTYLKTDGTSRLPNEMGSARAIAENRPINNLETGIVTENGEIIWVQVSAAPLALPDASAVVITQDITERKQAEQALRESKERFRELTENIDEVFWLSDRRHTAIFYVSPAYEKLWGRSCDSLYASPRSWIEAIHPEDKERVVQILADHELQPAPDIIYRIIRPDGSTRWVHARGFPVKDADGKIVRVAGVVEDITERKLAEEALRESETKFRRLLASNIIGVVFWTLEGDVLDANDLFLNMVGYTREDLRQGNLNWKKLTPPEYAQVDKKAVAQLTATGACASFEKEYIRKDGGRVSILIGSALLEPKKDAGSSFVIDITERKRVELALDERLRFETLVTELSAAFANLPTPTVDQEIDKWLKNLVEFLDLDRAAFDQVREDGMTLSRSHSHTARGIDPLSLNVADDQTPWITEQLLRGSMVKWARIPDDISEQAPNEKEFAARIGAKSVLSIPVGIGGSVICAISFTSMRIYCDWPDEMVARLRLVGEIFANAIARKRAEEALFRREAELNEAQRLASIGSWEWDILADGVTCSNEVRRIYGREDQNSPDRPFSEAVHPDDRARRSAAVDAALKGGSPYNAEFRIIRPDKSVRFVHSRGRLIYDESGKPVRMLGMTQDITERKRTAKELEEANDQLRLLSRRLFEVQEEERRHLARELHDEIGQALTAAKINLQSITGNGGSATVARLQETTAILDRLLGQVRKISLDLRPSMLDDLGLVPALRSLLDQQGRRASVAVRFSAENIPEKLDPEIQTTCFRIAQEAITNTLRHAHATHVDVDLRRENGKLRLLIRDNGIGFDVESAQAQTVGLGLIGIKERAALVGGRAKIISSPNNGTTIEVSAPLTRSERQDRDSGK